MHQFRTCKNFSIDQVRIDVYYDFCEIFSHWNGMNDILRMIHKNIVKKQAKNNNFLTKRKQILFKAEKNSDWSRSVF